MEAFFNFTIFGGADPLGRGYTGYPFLLDIISHLFKNHRKFSIEALTLLIPFGILITGAVHFL